MAPSPSTGTQASFDKYPWSTLPTSGSVPFVPPDDIAGKPVFKPSNDHGVIDNDGCVWKRDPTGQRVGNTHWDVNSPDGTHINVNGNDVPNEGEINH